MLKLRLNYKVVCLTELDKAHKKKQCWSTECCIQSDEPKFVNIFSVNKVAMLCYVMLCYVMLCYVM